MSPMSRYWLVWVDDTPSLPDRPLTAEQAVDLFEEEIVDDPDTKVEIRQCTEQDLAFAGIDHGPEDNTTETIADLDAVDVRVLGVPQTDEVTR